MVENSQLKAELKESKENESRLMVKVEKNLDYVSYLIEEKRNSEQKSFNDSLDESVEMRVKNAQ